ncbi:HK97 family phage prohead protease [Burkholderia sp. ABCPW 111]|uniref:HK97 family phage prohead protease n=1 Tax=Burkholderia sp. ABCPW 111 TaxID=1820025 RepID=UPI00053173EB|nr:HK97 family phage prohead protease [Burkholderia sp. ABCPW 111]KGR93873.1 caudovirus prohead protease family protein [Burkholderia sp. ABCPW 111]
MQKSFSSIEIKSLQAEKREIEGIASTPRTDRHGDIVEPFGLAFEKEAALLLNHDHSQPIGTVTFGTPTPHGLPFTAKIAKVATPGVVKDRTDEAWDSVKSGVIKGVSIGFIASRKDMEELPNGGRRIKRASVHELSLVAVPANPDAAITAFKSAQLVTHKETMIRNSAAEQIRKAVSMTHEDAVMASIDTVRSDIVKASVPVATTENNPELYRPAQVPGVLYPPTTAPIITALAQMGALQLPPNVRALTQDKLLQAAEIGEDEGFPAVAPTIDAVLSDARKFGVVMVFDDSILAATNYSAAVVQYVQGQLEMAANNATDAAVIDTFTRQGKAAASVQEGIAAFDGDLRTACWIGSPATLATLQDAANPNIGPRGGTYKTLQAIPSLAVPAGKLILVDVKRTAVFDGPQWIERSNQADITVDTPDGQKVVHLLQENKTALKITKYADAKIIASPQVITLQ